MTFLLVILSYSWIVNRSLEARFQNLMTFLAKFYFAKIFFGVGGRDRFTFEHPCVVLYYKLAGGGGGTVYSVHVQ